MKKYIILLLTAAFIFAGCSLTDNEVAAPSSVKGAQVWVNNCSRCHNMRDPQDYNDGSWNVIGQHMRIRAGLTGSEVRDTVAFLQKSNDPIARRKSTINPENENIQKLSQQKADLNNGKKVFETTCVACHGVSGKGILPGTPDFNLAESSLAKKSDLELINNVINGFQTQGSPLAMPPRGGNPNLSDDDIRDVIKYLKGIYLK